MEQTPAKMYFEVEVYSHHFCIKNVRADKLSIVISFAKQYVQMGPVKKGRFFVRGPIKVFASRCAPNGEYRFHYGQWADFQTHLAALGVTPEDYKISSYNVAEGQVLGFKTLEKWQPRAKQPIVIEYLTNPLPSKKKLVQLQAGQGKLAANHTPVKIPHGWAPIGSLKVGDLVATRDGTYTPVVGVYPQGKVKNWRITFQDGRSTLAGGEHLWKVMHCGDSPNSQWRVENTYELIRILGLANNKIYVPLCEPIEETAILHEIDPYIIGTLIGDRCRTVPGMTRFNPDSFIATGILEMLPEYPEEDYQDHPWAQELQRLGLYGKRSLEKTIPDEYVSGSVGQRFALLQGLMDANGAVSDTDSGTCVYCTTNQVLAEQIVSLARSLGGIAQAMPGTKQHTCQGEEKANRPAFFISIRMKHPGNLFRLSCEKERVSDNNQHANGFNLRITKIEPEGDFESTCIAVEHPERLYVTEHYIVTHNTFCALAAEAIIGKSIMVFLKPQFIQKWIEDFPKTWNCTKEDACVIKGSASLMKLIDLAMSGGEIPKIIVMSNRTFQNWISAYERDGDATLDQGYGCRPHEFMTACNVGLKLTDEVHMDFHLNFIIDLYTHVEWSHALSATLIADDPFLSRMQYTAYPEEMRLLGMEYIRYITSYALIYEVTHPGTLKYLGGTDGKTYNHIEYEKNFFRQKKLMRDFLQMLADQVKEHYIDRKADGDTLLVYAASIQMASTITEYLALKFPDQLVRRYVEDDPYDHLMSSDIAVSTLLSAGTGHDIPDLITVILTPAVSSSASNIQGFGRLRDLPGKETRFIYFTCKDIDKHVQYWEKKEELLSRMAKTVKEIRIREPLG